MQDGGVRVGDVVGIFGGMEADVVGGPVCHAALDPAARHPDAEGVGVVVAAVRALRAGGAAEFGGEDDEGFVEQAT